jgi:hypothetical protein
MECLNPYSTTTEPITITFVKGVVPFIWENIIKPPQFYSIFQAITAFEAYNARDIDTYTKALNTTDPIKLQELFDIAVELGGKHIGNIWRNDFIIKCIEAQLLMFPAMKEQLIETPEHDLVYKQFDTLLYQNKWSITYNEYGNILQKKRKQFIIENKNIDTILETLLDSLYTVIKLGYPDSNIFVGGSYPLHKIAGSPSNWTPNDIDIFIPNGISMNFMGRIHREILSDFNLIASHNRCFTYEIPGHTMKIQIVRMDTMYKDYTAMYNTTDISITNCFIIHSDIDTDSGDLSPLYQNWSLYYRDQELLNDIKNNTQRFYRHKDDPYYEYGLKRVEKYKKRGFTNVIMEPKELDDILPMYDPEQGQYPLE